MATSNIWTRLVGREPEEKDFRGCLKGVESFVIIFSNQKIGLIEQQMVLLAGSVFWDRDEAFYSFQLNKINLGEMNA